MDTRELVVQDWRDTPLLRAPVVRDVDTGAEKARAAVPSPTQAFLFPAPGFGRDVYYQSLTTIVRVAVT